MLGKLEGFLELVSYLDQAEGMVLSFQYDIKCVLASKLRVKSIRIQLDP